MAELTPEVKAELQRLADLKNEEARRYVAYRDARYEVADQYAKVKRLLGVKRKGEVLAYLEPYSILPQHLRQEG